MANTVHTGTDLDIDLPAGLDKAYVVYWGIEHEVIKRVTMHAETLYPLNLIQSIFTFKPDMAIGANVTFEYVDGTMTPVTVFRF
jgi:hypothetical protein